RLRGAGRRPALRGREGEHPPLEPARVAHDLHGHDHRPGDGAPGVDRGRDLPPARPPAHAPVGALGLTQTAPNQRSASGSAISGPPTMPTTAGAPTSTARVMAAIMPPQTN